MKKLAQAACAVSPGTLLYTVPAGYITDINDIVVSNTNGTDTTITLNMVASGGSPSISNQFFPSALIKANTVMQWTGVQTMNAGDFIQGAGGATGVNVRISGDERRIGT